MTNREKEISNIYEEYKDRLYSFTRKWVSNQEDAKDIIQDVFYQLTKTIEDTLSPIEHLSGWLFKVTRNMISNKYKKKSEESFPDWEYDEDGILSNDFSKVLFNENNPTPETEYLQNLVWEELEFALENLPANQKEAFHLTEIEGLSTKEAAQKMNTSQNTLLSRKHYAVLYLRKQLSTIYKELLEN
ncbi:MAG TPA: sigma-70 family RNA polymerase sigma factor [Chitinophagaceae bacterium]|nr:sigma-70 family RNA polymerase sigma factor [Chitinophagaceae bacterium]